MKKFISVLILGFMITSFTTLGFSQSSPKEAIQDQKVRKQSVQEQKEDTTLKASYTCPMHAEVLQDKAGKCPTCKMNLVKKEVVEVVYTCPMHSDVLKNQPGKCPKCKMTLVKKEPAKKIKSKKI